MVQSCLLLSAPEGLRTRYHFILMLSVSTVLVTTATESGSKDALNVRRLESGGTGGAIMGGKTGSRKKWDVVWIG